MAKKKPQSFCFWCGKSHKENPPEECKRLSRTMNAVCKSVPTWKVMVLLEQYGTPGLYQLAAELRVPVK